MADPFTIRIFVPDGDPEGVRLIDRIFVPDGDPEGVRLIDRMNWTGLGFVFPRLKWPDVEHRSEMKRPGSLHFDRLQ